MNSIEFSLLLRGWDVPRLVEGAIPPIKILPGMGSDEVVMRVSELNFSIIESNDLRYSLDTHDILMGF